MGREPTRVNSGPVAAAVPANSASSQQSFADGLWGRNRRDIGAEAGSSHRITADEERVDPPVGCDATRRVRYRRRGEPRHHPAPRRVHRNTVRRLDGPEFLAGQLRRDPRRSPHGDEEGTGRPRVLPRPLVRTLQEAAGPAAGQSGCLLRPRSPGVCHQRGHSGRQQSIRGEEGLHLPPTQRREPRCDPCLRGRRRRQRYRRADDGDRAALDEDRLDLRG